MYLETIFGPMFSGKSTYLYHLYQNHKDNHKILTINYFQDKRYSNGTICTHNQQEIKQNPDHYSLESINDIFMYITITDYDIIIIDEAQFFNDIYEFILELETFYKGKVFVAGLNLDAKRNLFGNFYKIIMISDSIIQLKGKCHYCEQNSLFTIKTTTNNKQIDIGGIDKYLPVCKECYNK